ncbi:MAG: AgmX/PglI C-terminal domain-containing protein [Myxococcales bacterium]|nr:AgmX/PglI C-terminal domain-containing protein [Myxococcales bacterium]
MRKHRPGKLAVKIGHAVSSVGLDRSIIRRHIRSQRLRLRHCYEERLLAAPKLAGTVATSFAIGGNGKVIGSTAKGIGDAPLQDCVAGAVASIEFPRTKGDSVVNVRYPFTFQSAAQ